MSRAKKPRSSAKNSPAKRTPRNNPHASSACTRCRRKRVKCDGQTDGDYSVCSRCVDSGSQCVWTAKKDRRIARGGECNDCEGRLARISELEAEVASLKAQLSAATSQNIHAPESQTESPQQEQANPLFEACNTQTLFTQTDAYANAFQHNVQQPFLGHPAQATDVAFGDPTLSSIFPQPVWGPDYAQYGQGNIAYRPDDALFYTAPPFFPGAATYHGQAEGGWTA